MPRSSKRIKLLRGLRKLCNHRLLALQQRYAYLEDDEIEDEIDAWAFRKLCEAESQRYSTQRKQRKYSMNHFREDLEESDQRGEVPFLTDDEFLQKYRMSRESFNELVGLIKDHVVFKRGRRGPKQAPPEYQLMVFLKYIGTEGSGSSNADLRNIFRIGRGTNDLYKKRDVKAIRSLRDRYYKWPTSEERAEIAERIRQKYGFPNCCGLGDGTLNPLAFEPQTVDAPDYSGRKYGYSISTLVVNDNQKRIIYYLAGWPGSAHDNRIFRNSQLFQKPSEFFSSTQYLLGDSAFGCRPFMVSAYKKP